MDFSDHFLSEKLHNFSAGMFYDFILKYKINKVHGFVTTSLFKLYYILYS